MRRQWSTDRDVWFELVKRWEKVAENTKTRPPSRISSAICWRRRSLAISARNGPRR
ncbi:hypothetical protein NKH77_19190 [Streptomyces sp. M19]